MSGDQIEAWRKARGVTQAELAGWLGLSQPTKGGQVTVARWETGVQSPAPYLRLALERLEQLHGPAPRRK
jgi:transcriptional regulator with XRE-family HTH domain